MNGTTSWHATDLCLFPTKDLTLLADAFEARALDVRHRALRVDEAECFPIVEPLDAFTCTNQTRPDRRFS